MSNRPNFRKQRPAHQVEMGHAMVERILETEEGRKIAEIVDSIKTWCELVEVDFDEVSDLFDNFAATSEDDLPTTLIRFRAVLRQMFEMYGVVSDPVAPATSPSAHEARKLILPGDKDFRQP